jgi:MFS family permease
MFGRIAAGFMGDRLGHKRAMAICLMIAITAWPCFSSPQFLWMLYLFAVIYGFSHGGFFSIISPLLARLFGTRSLGSILGIVIFFGTIGGSIGMPLSGFIYDVTGTYRIAFLIMLGLIVSGLVILSMVKSITAAGSDGK